MILIFNLFRMLADRLTKLDKEIREYFLSRHILRDIFTDSKYKNIQDAWLLSNKNFKEVRKYVTSMEGEEANSSYDEGYLKGNEELTAFMISEMLDIIEKEKQKRIHSKEFLDGMKYMFDLLK